MSARTCRLPSGSPANFRLLDLRDLYPDPYHTLVKYGKGGRERYVRLKGSLFQQIMLFAGERRPRMRAMDPARRVA